MTDEELKSSIKALETANEQYNKNRDDNEQLIRKYQWELWYAEIHKKQMEISNQFIITKCGKCGEFVHNGMTCSNPECGANPVYTGKEMVHGLLSIRSKRRILN